MNTNKSKHYKTFEFKLLSALLQLPQKDQFYVIKYTFIYCYLDNYVLQKAIGKAKIFKYKWAIWWFSQGLLLSY